MAFKPGIALVFVLALELKQGQAKPIATWTCADISEAECQDHTEYGDVGPDPCGDWHLWCKTTPLPGGLVYWSAGWQWHDGVAGSSSTPAEQGAVFFFEEDNSEFYLKQVYHSKLDRTKVEADGWAPADTTIWPATIHSFTSEPGDRIHAYYQVGQATDGSEHFLSIKDFIGCIRDDQEGCNADGTTTTPAPTVTSTPTFQPTNKPTNKPTAQPGTPTHKPTDSPTLKPTPIPTRKPTPNPTKNPTKAPTKAPTPHPTPNPTKNPTIKPTTSVGNAVSSSSSSSSIAAPTGGICFSGDSLLTLEDGSSKKFRDLQVGDVILSADRNGKLSYSPVVFLPHNPNDIARAFDQIVTSSGKTVEMTPNHLILTCDGALVTARSLKSSECVHTVDGHDTVVRTAKNLMRDGIYTAVTKKEFLVVNGVVASPFALAHGVAHSFFDRSEVTEWCKDNSHLVEAAKDEEVKGLAQSHRNNRSRNRNRNRNRSRRLTPQTTENGKNNGDREEEAAVIASVKVELGITFLSAGGCDEDAALNPVTLMATLSKALPNIEHLHHVTVSLDIEEEQAKTSPAEHLAETRMEEWAVSRPNDRQDEAKDQRSKDERVHQRTQKRIERRLMERRRLDYDNGLSPVDPEVFHQQRRQLLLATAAAAAEAENFSAWLVHFQIAVPLSEAGFAEPSEVADEISSRLQAAIAGGAITKELLAQQEGVQQCVDGGMDVSLRSVSTNDHELEVVREMTETEEEAAEADSTSTCVDLMETLFENYKDEGLGWGTNGWGYKNFKTLRGVKGEETSLTMRLSGFSDDGIAE